MPLKRRCKLPKPPAVKLSSSRWDRRRPRETVRKALSMSADSAIHVQDAGLAGSDALGTSLVLAKALEGKGFRPHHLRLGVDRRARIECCSGNGRRTTQSLVDLRQQRRGSLDLEVQRSSAPKTEYGYDEVTGKYRRRVRRREDQRTALPILPGHHGGQEEASRTIGTADLGVDAAQVGLGGSWSAVVEFADAPPMLPEQLLPTRVMAESRSLTTCPQEVHLRSALTMAEILVR